MGQIVDDMEDMDDEQLEDLMHEMEEDSDYGNDQTESPSRSSPGQKVGGMLRASDTGKLESESSPEAGQSSKQQSALPNFQKARDEDEIDDNYSEGDLDENDEERLDLLNFNQVDKDSSI